MTVGASGAFPLAFLAAFDPGDRDRDGGALLPALREHPDRARDAAAADPACGPETRWQPSVAMLEALDPPPAGLILASPCNPAGTMLPPAEFAAIAALVRRAPACG